jgi:Flp pilus assembly protein TadG
MSILQRLKGRRNHGERGAALVEMALVAPLLVILLFGIWTVARAYNVKNTMDHAVREGARFAATIDPWDPNTSPGEVRAVIDAELAASAVPTASVTTGCIDWIEQGDDGCTIDGSDQVINAPADQVAVNIQFSAYPLNFIVFSVPVDFSSQAISRHES